MARVLSESMEDRKADGELTRLCLSAVVFYAWALRRQFYGASCPAEPIICDGGMVCALGADFHRPPPVTR